MCAERGRPHSSEIMLELTRFLSRFHSADIDLFQPIIFYIFIALSCAKSHFSCIGGNSGSEDVLLHHTSIFIAWIGKMSDPIKYDNKIETIMKGTGDFLCFDY